jgi:hypothetical protein
MEWPRFFAVTAPPTKVTYRNRTKLVIQNSHYPQSAARNFDRLYNEVSKYG